MRRCRFYTEMTAVIRASIACSLSTQPVSLSDCTRLHATQSAAFWLGVHPPANNATCKLPAYSIRRSCAWLKLFIFNDAEPCFQYYTCVGYYNALQLELGRYSEISRYIADIDIIGIVSVSALCFRYRFFRYIDIVSVTTKISKNFDILVYFSPLFNESNIV